MKQQQGEAGRGREGKSGSVLGGPAGLIRPERTQAKGGGSAKSESLGSFSQRREQHRGVTGEEAGQRGLREDREEDFLDDEGANNVINTKFQKKHQ